MDKERTKLMAAAAALHGNPDDAAHQALGAKVMAKAMTVGDVEAMRDALAAEFAEAVDAEHNAKIAATTASRVAQRKSDIATEIAASGGDAAEAMAEADTATAEAAAASHEKDLAVAAKAAAEAKRAAFREWLHVQGRAEMGRHFVPFPASGAVQMG